MQIENKGGINYELPNVLLLQETGLGTCEFAARTAYDSFAQSENEHIRNLDFLTSEGTKQPKHVLENAAKSINDVEHSDLLDNLAWAYFHHSVLEHANLTFLIKGTSRGVLQEHARHRIQGITVRSTRYTMSPVLNAFLTDVFMEPNSNFPSDWFTKTLLKMNIFVTTDKQYNILQITDIWNKLKFQRNAVGYVKFNKLLTSKEQYNWLTSELSNDITHEDVFTMLQRLKKKRNVGDTVKHIVNDNWKVDMVVTMNLRAYKNYLGLRDSGAAYFQIRWLAKAMVAVTPMKYLKLIVKGEYE